MGLEDVSEFYEDFPLQAAVLTMGVKASIADGIAQVRALQSGLETKWYHDLEFRRNFLYMIYGGLFIRALGHYEYDVIFPELFGTEQSLATSFKEVLFDNFVTAPLAWLPPAYCTSSRHWSTIIPSGWDCKSTSTTLPRMDCCSSIGGYGFRPRALVLPWCQII